MTRETVMTRSSKLMYGILLGAAGLLLLAGTIIPSIAHALTVDTPRDCDTNAVIYCGATTTTELHHKYNRTPDAQVIYRHFGITDWNIRNLTNNAVAGKVTQGGRVLVGKEEVATGAMTAGRVNMAGSTTVTSEGVTFYKRPPSASFQQPSLPAFVVLNSDGTFKYAIIASCGNPVTATPKEKPQPPKQPEQPQPPAPTPPPAPAPTPPAPAPQPPAPEPPAAPAANSSSSSSASSTSSSSAVANVTINQEQQRQEAAPPPAPVAVAPATVEKSVTVAPAATELPKTGPSQALTLAGLSTLAGTLAHLIYTRRKAQQL